MLELATDRLPKLTSVANLFEALHENAILYCALKGNEKHMLVSMAGESDIDILFDENQKEKLELILAKLGFKKFEAIKPKQYPNIVDFLTLDVGSGKIIHLHTHYRICVGKPYLKGYQLDIGHHVLNTRIFNEDFGTYCISPAAELMLLYLTESLKLRHRDCISIYLDGKVNVSQKASYEYNWLRKRVTDEELKFSLRQVFNDEETELFNGQFDRKHLHRLAPIIKRQIGRNRLYSSLEALSLRWYREITVSILRKLSRTMSWPILSMRTNPRGGVMVALTGDHRADPLTFGRLLKETFGKKMDVYTVDLEWPANLLSSVGLPQFPGHPDFKSYPKRHSEGGPGKWLRSFKVLFITLKNAVKMFCADSARRKGALVICNHRIDEDLTAVAYPPSPRDSLPPKNSLFRILDAMRHSVYMKARTYAPDLTFQLTAAAEDVVIHGASQGMSADDKGVTPHTERSGFSNTRHKVMAIDARKPLKGVLDSMKTEIWDIL